MPRGGCSAAYVVPGEGGARRHTGTPYDTATCIKYTEEEGSDFSHGNDTDVLADTYVALVTTRFLVLQRVHDERVSSFKGHPTVRARVLAVNGALCLGLLLCGCGLSFPVRVIIFYLFRCLAVQWMGLWFSLWPPPPLRHGMTLHWVFRWSSPLAWPWSDLKTYTCLMHLSMITLIFAQPKQCL